MTKLNSILVQFLLLICIFLSGGCKENPNSPFPSNNNSYSGKFHGTWLNINMESDSLHISFDSTSLRFLEQAGYDFGIRREFPGNFIADNSTIFLNYGYGITSRFWYRFDNDTLLLGDSSYHFSRKFKLIETSPDNYGWSVKSSIISEQTYFPIGFVGACCYSDSLLIVLGSDNNLPYLIRLNTRDGKYTKELANGIRAVDATGTFLWIATDSTIEKRALFGNITLASFSYRNAVGPNCIATGISVGTDYCFLMTVYLLHNQGILLKFNLSGDLLSSTQTSSVIKDLCLVYNRLFCVVGDEIFLELNPSTGYVIKNYNLVGRPFGNSIDGIAFSRSAIQLAGVDSVGNLRISEIAIPSEE